jgi:hypothetical protein
MVHCKIFLVVYLQVDVVILKHHIYEYVYILYFSDKCSTFPKDRVVYSTLIVTNKLILKHEYFSNKSSVFFIKTL